MYCKIVVTDACSKWHSVEDIHEQIVNFNIILLKHFLPKSIEFSDHSRLMISSQHHYTFWIIQFETEDEQADFYLEKPLPFNELVALLNLLNIL